MNKKLTSKKVKKYLTLSLIAYSSLWFIFALLSGAPQQENGLLAILKNSPNSLPWLLFLLILFGLRKRPTWLATISLAFGLFTVMFFGSYQDPIVFLLVSAPYLLLGTLLFLPYLSKLKAKE